jgi:hypothetical protein
MGFDVLNSYVVCLPPRAFPIDTPRPSLIFFNARSFPEAGIFLASPGLGSLKPPQEDKISKTKNAGMIFFKTFSKFGIFFINA